MTAGRKGRDGHALQAGTVSSKARVSATTRSWNFGSRTSTEANRDLGRCSCASCFIYGRFTSATDHSALVIVWSICQCAGKNLYLYMLLIIK
jgi:hypothetical protein